MPFLTLKYKPLLVALCIGFVLYQVHAYTIIKRKSKEEKSPGSGLKDEKTLDEGEEVFPGRLCFSPSPKLLPVNESLIHISDDDDNPLQKEILPEEIEHFDSSKHLSISSNNVAEGERIGAVSDLNGAGQWLVPELEYQEWKNRGNAGTEI